MGTQTNFYSAVFVVYYSRCKKSPPMPYERIFWWTLVKILGLLTAYGIIPRNDTRSLYESW